MRPSWAERSNSVAEGYGRASGDGVKENFETSSRRRRKLGAAFGYTSGDRPEDKALQGWNLSAEPQAVMGRVRLN